MTIARTLPFLALLGLAACGSPRSTIPPELATEEVEERALAETPNVHVFDGILTSGQPSAQGLAAARDLGVRTVLNIRKPEELAKLDFDEATTVVDLGMSYVQLPWGSAAELDDGVFDRTRAMLNELERPMLYHCASANRVGATWIPWRVLDGGLDLEAAVLEAKAIGLRSAELEAKARDYVARHRE